MYYTFISTIESHSTINSKFMDRDRFVVWHNRLGHTETIMMRKILENSLGNSLMTKRIPQFNDFACIICSQGKLIIRPSSTKVRNESLTFLECIQGDICGPIHSPCGPFRYFMVLIDASTKWSHVSLLSTRNLTFARLLAQLIRLRAQFLDYPRKTILLDNASEFTSQHFNDYCMIVGIDVEHLVSHVLKEN